jgi:hypothetical protein
MIHVKHCLVIQAAGQIDSRETLAYVGSLGDLP